MTEISVARDRKLGTCQPGGEHNQRRESVRLWMSRFKRLGRWQSFLDFTGGKDPRCKGCLLRWRWSEVGRWRLESPKVEIDVNGPGVGVKQKENQDTWLWASWSKRISRRNDGEVECISAKCKRKTTEWRSRCDWWTRTWMSLSNAKYGAKGIPTPHLG